MNNYTSLIERLSMPASSINFILNPKFGEWNERIIDNLRNRTRKEKTTYRLNGDSELVAACLNHIESNSKPLDSQNVVLLMHPLYMFICDKYNESQKLDADNYIKKFTKLLNNRDSLDANFVLLDTVHFYSGRTSLLLEDGAVDRTMLTKYDRGYLDNNSDLKYLEDKQLFVAGGYTNQCILHILHTLTSRSRFKDNVWAIEDLMLKNPKWDENVESIRVYDVVQSGPASHVPFERTIKLDEFFQITKK